MRLLVLVVAWGLAACSSSKDPAREACEATVERILTLKESTGGGVPLAKVAPELERMSPECTQVHRVLEMAQQRGGGADVLVPGFAGALLECRCNVSDLPKFEAQLREVFK